MVFLEGPHPYIALFGHFFFILLIFCLYIVVSDFVDLCMCVSHVFSFFFIIKKFKFSHLFSKKGRRHGVR